MEPLRVAENQAQTLWKIEPRYTDLQFSVKTFFFFTVKGRFTDFAGTILFDENDVRRSSVEVTIRADSIRTGIKRRDAHLRSGDFLNVQQYPEIQFQSTSVKPGRDRDTLLVTGLLKISGVEREITLDVLETDRSQSPQGDEVIYFSALVEIDRLAFGIKYGLGLIGRMIKVVVPAQATKIP